MDDQQINSAIIAITSKLDNLRIDVIRTIQELKNEIKNTKIYDEVKSGITSDTWNDVYTWDCRPYTEAKTIAIRNNDQGNTLLYKMYYYYGSVEIETQAQPLSPNNMIPITLDRTITRIKLQVKTQVSAATAQYDVSFVGIK